MTTQPQSRTGNVVGWWVLAVLPGVILPALGVPGAALAAWQCRRYRAAFICIAVAWGVVSVFFMPWGGNGVGTGGKS